MASNEKLSTLQKMGYLLYFVSFFVIIFLFYYFINLVNSSEIEKFTNIMMEPYVSSWETFVNKI
jgi:hypothetical protein